MIHGRKGTRAPLESQVERYAALARRLGVSLTGEADGLPVPASATAAAQRSLERAGWTGKSLVAFAPGARWPTKTWPDDFYARLIGAMPGRGYEPLLIGGANDAELNAAVARKSGAHPLDLTGALSIRESAAVLRRCKALVTNDSAPLHLAEAVGTSVVAFYGPTVREFGYFPRLPRSRVLERDLSCRPCSRNGARSCPYGTKECLRAIGPDAALDALDALLEERKVLP